MSAQVHIHPGALPPFWKRDAIYFANLLSLFYGNEGETDELIEMVGGIESYGGRLLPIIDLVFRGDNVLVLEKAPDRNLVDFFRDDLKLSLPEMIILPHEDYLALSKTESTTPPPVLTDVLSRLTDHPAQWIDGFVTDDVLARISDLLRKKTITTLEGSKRGNNKYLLSRFLEEEQLPRFDTRIAENEEQAREHMRELARTGYTRAVLKSQIGASGIGMTKIATKNAGDATVPDHLFFEGPCLVQGWLDGSVRNLRRVGSPSVQLFLNDDAVHVYDLTEQILSDDSVHEGNLAIPPYIEGDPGLKKRILELGARTGQWLHKQGYRGTASGDFLIVERDGEVHVITCELNARITGATYPSILARHFRPKGSWLMRNLKFQPPIRSGDLLQQIERAGYLYHQGRETGILPINFNSNEDDEIVKGQFLCLADETEDCIRLLLDVERVLPVKWIYDRD